MATYLAYVAGGNCRDTHAPTKDADGNPIRAGMIRKQLWVIETLRRMGIEAWCGTRVEFKRAGKQRDWKREDVPALPNYIVVEMNPQDMFAVTEIEHVAPTMSLIAGGALHGFPSYPGIKTADGKGWKVKPQPAKMGLLAFKAIVEADFKAAVRVDANSRAEVTEYRANHPLRVISGPFADMLVTFDRLVRADHGQFKKVRVETDAGYTVDLDPLDVRSA